jgi:hypothetical protein
MYINKKKQMAEMRRVLETQAGRLKELAALPMSLQVCVCVYMCTCVCILYIYMCVCNYNIHRAIIFGANGLFKEAGNNSDIHHFPPSLFYV